LTLNERLIVPGLAESELSGGNLHDSSFYRF
jgi:hypothetical protein